MSEDDEDIKNLRKKLEKIQLEKQIFVEEQALERLKKEASGNPLRISKEFQADHDHIADKPIDQTEQNFQEFNDTDDSKVPNNHFNIKSSLEEFLTKVKKIRFQKLKDIRYKLSKFEDVLQKIKKIRFKLFTFKGRIGRADYNCAWIVTIASFLSLVFVDETGILDGLGILYFIFGNLFVLSIILFHFSVTTRRFHDLNKSAILIIPIYIWVGIWWYVFDRTISRETHYLLSYGSLSEHTLSKLRFIFGIMMAVLGPALLALCCFRSRDFFNEENKYGFKESIFGFDFLKPSSPSGSATPSINNGERSAISEKHHSNDDLSYQSKYVEGKENIISKQYNKNGGLVTYQDGDKKVEKRYNKNGALEMEKIYQDGDKKAIERVFYKSGAIKIVRPYVDGKINGVGKRYYESGSVEKEILYKNDKMQGVAKGFYKSGELMWERTYKYDKPTGRYKKYRKNGKPKGRLFL